jgi:large subunit ribosomal protein L18
MTKTSEKVISRKKRAQRIRLKLSGTNDKPRMSVFRSNRHIYVQIIDDTLNRTLAAMSTEDKEFDRSTFNNKCDQAKQIGIIIANKAKKAGIEKVVFDRNGYLYHGRVKALSEGAREGGLLF